MSQYLIYMNKFGNLSVDSTGLGSRSIPTKCFAVFSANRLYFKQVNRLQVRAFCFARIYSVMHLLTWHTLSLSRSLMKIKSYIKRYKKGREMFETNFVNFLKIFQSEIFDRAFLYAVKWRRQNREPRRRSFGVRKKTPSTCREHQFGQHGTICRH